MKWDTWVKGGKKGGVFLYRKKNKKSPIQKERKKGPEGKKPGKYSDCGGVQKEGSRAKE